LLRLREGGAGHVIHDTALPWLWTMRAGVPSPSVGLINSAILLEGPDSALTVSSFGPAVATSGLFVSRTYLRDFDACLRRRGGGLAHIVLPGGRLGQRLRSPDLAAMFSGMCPRARQVAEVRLNPAVQPRGRVDRNPIVEVLEGRPSARACVL